MPGLRSKRAFLTFVDFGEVRRKPGLEGPFPEELSTEGVNRADKAAVDPFQRAAGVAGLQVPTSLRPLLSGGRGTGPASP